MEKEHVMLTKSFEFALEIIRIYKEMKSQHEYEISRQLLRSGISIGANAEEPTAAYRKKDWGINHSKLKAENVK